MHGGGLEPYAHPARDVTGLRVGAVGDPEDLGSAVGDHFDDAHGALLYRSCAARVLLACLLAYSSYGSPLVAITQRLPTPGNR
ncbi:hypothetical protein GCM10010497_56070 [Streptomyces cinereoruber]|uniref:Uncharacterized protein n=1 Tax=Streptomyces cinereoruber TaxID=67260 RepID=A0AAV4KTX3_9ACTN|nr:hypothetical protein GCM10010497_56070 [Streptomyces cinereoruber]